jgi:hypothetical protein
VRLEALEVPFEVRCAGSGAATLADSVLAAWEWCAGSGGGSAGVLALQEITVVLDGNPAELAEVAGGATLHGLDLPTLMDRLSPLVTRLAVTERRHDLTMFHACAVADPTSGDTVVLYGPSGTGKTTLARTLCTDLVYLTDETAGVDDQLRISPYPKPLSILVRPDDPVKEQASPGELGLVRPRDLTYRLRALVQLRRDATHRGAAIIEDLATIDALPELVAQTSYTREMERPLHRLADLAHQVGGVRRVTYAEAEQVRPLVRAILDGDA